MCIKRAVLCLIGAIFLWAAQLSADPIADLYDTGVGINGISLPDGTSPDPHYKIISGSDGSVASATTVKTSASGFPVGSFWNADSTTSAWIMPSAGYPGNSTPSIFLPVGFYDYQTTFTLPVGVDSVNIAADLATDDLGEAIFLNGESVGAGAFNLFYSYTPISFTSSNVLAGTNTLVFETYNTESSPTGLRVDGITGSYAVAVPEPSAFVLLGVAVLGLARRQPNNSIVAFNSRPFA
jgi:hypothetical protein